MINKIFENKGAYIYFETFFKTKKRFPQSLVFEGLDSFASYFFALELARILNCKNDKNNPSCACTNCRWIKEGNHPLIISITPLDFKEDTAKTVISVKQIKKITSMINETSDYHRFFIFSNAKIEPYNNSKQKKYIDAGFSTWTKDWQPLPLNRKILQEEASNALLKSIEEAPDKITFVFLTDTKENIISTVVSRSLIFQFPKAFEKNNIESFDFFENYPDIEIKTALEYVQTFLEKYTDTIAGLDFMQNYLFSLMKTNFNLKDLIFRDIKKVEEAKKQITALVFPKNVLESLFISLSIEGRKV